MKVAMISCWFRHQIYSDYAEELRAALNERLDEEVTVVSGDCRCAVRDGDRYTNAVDQNARFLTMTYQPNPSRKIKMPGKLRADWKIGRAYLELAADADVIHFQEVTNAFGTVPALSFLAAPSDKVRVVTVHELERFRNRFKTLYRLYNRADAILVHGRDLKETLVDLGVDERRIHVVPWGARVASFVAERREGILYYGGHHLWSGKGFEDFLLALQIVRRSGTDVPATILGFFEPRDLEAAKHRVQEMGLADGIRWVDHPTREDYERLYAEALLTVIPYTAGSAVFPAAQAMAHGTPVVATRSVELPEYLGRAALYVDDHAPVQIAMAVSQYLDSEELREKHSDALLERARVSVDWSVVAERTLRIYRGEEAYINPDPWAEAEKAVGSVTVA